MPLTWTIDPELKLVTAVAEGEFTRTEVDAYLDAVDQAGAHAYRKLFDGERASSRMKAEDWMAVGIRMRSYHKTGPMGALAVVVPEALVEPLDRVLGMLATAERPMRLFRKLAPARRWIVSQP